MRSAEGQELVRIPVQPEITPEITAAPEPVKEVPAVPAASVEKTPSSDATIKAIISSMERMAAKVGVEKIESRLPAISELIEKHLVESGVPEAQTLELLAKATKLFRIRTAMKSKTAGAQISVKPDSMGAPEIVELEPTAPQPSVEALLKPADTDLETAPALIASLPEETNEPVAMIPQNKKPDSAPEPSGDGQKKKESGSVASAESSSDSLKDRVNDYETEIRERLAPYRTQLAADRRAAEQAGLNEKDLKDVFDIVKSVEDPTLIDSHLQELLRYGKNVLDRVHLAREYGQSQLRYENQKQYWIQQTVRQVREAAREKNLVVAADHLENIKHRIVRAVLIREQELMNEALEKNMDPQEQGIIIRAVGWWGSLSRNTRLTIGTGITATVLVGAGASGAGVVAGVGSRIAGGFLSAVIGQKVSDIAKKVTDWDKNRRFEKLDKGYQRTLSAIDFEKIDPAQMEQISNQYLAVGKEKAKIEKRANIANLLTGAAAGSWATAGFHMWLDALGITPQQLSKPRAGQESIQSTPNQPSSSPIEVHPDPAPLYHPPETSASAPAVSELVKTETSSATVLKGEGAWQPVMRQITENPGKFGISQEIIKNPASLKVAAEKIAASALQKAGFIYPDGTTRLGISEAGQQVVIDENLKVNVTPAEKVYKYISDIIPKKSRP